MRTKIRHLNSLHLWSTITGIALTIALVLTFLPVQVSFDTKGILSISLSQVGATPGWSAWPNATTLISQTHVWDGNETWTDGQKADATTIITNFANRLWGKYGSNPIVTLGSGGSWDDAHVADSQVMFNGTSWIMLYAGFENDNDKQVGLATSSDGKNWTKYGSNPVLTYGTAGKFDDERAGSGPVIQDGGTLKMWYPGFDNTTVRSGLAYSTDNGQTWARQNDGNPVLSEGASGEWDQQHAIISAVIKEGSTYKAWYIGYYAAMNMSIGYATSTNGINWTKYGSNPVFGAGTADKFDDAVPEVCAVMRIADKYAMFYEGYDGAVTNKWNIGIAHSTDGITWTRDYSSARSDGAIMNFGASGSWDARWLLMPHPVWEPAEQTFYLYYTGASSTPVDKIGLAIEPKDLGLYRKPITISNASADYQTKVLVGESAGAEGEEVDCGGKCQPDFGDLRFTGSDNVTLLDYWVESITGTTPNQLATVWVQNDGTPSTTGYMYYGNVGAVTLSNGANTFLTYDDFERGSNGDPVGGGWTIALGDADISTEQDIGNVAGYFGTRSVKLIGAATVPSITRPQTAGNTYAIYMRYYQEAAVGEVPFFLHGNGTKRITIYIQADGSIRYYDTDWRDTLTDCAADTWVSFEIRNINFTAGTYDIWYNGSAIKTGAAMQSSAGDTNIIECAGIAVATQDVFVDNFIVRKFAATAQTFTFGAEQTPTPEVTNSPSSWAIGVVATSAAVYFSATGAQDDDYALITNTGNCAVDIQIQGQNIEGGSYDWVLASSAGTEQYSLYANAEATPTVYNIEVKSSSYNNLCTDLAEGDTYTWSMKFTSPTAFNPNDDGEQKGCTVTLVASAS